MISFIIHLYQLSKFSFTLKLALSLQSTLFCSHKSHFIVALRLKFYSLTFHCECLCLLVLCQGPQRNAMVEIELPFHLVQLSIFNSRKWQSHSAYINQIYLALTLQVTMIGINHHNRLWVYYFDKVPIILLLMDTFHQ